MKKEGIEREGRGVEREEDGDGKNEILWKIK